MMFESFTASAERALKRAELLAKRRDARSVEPLDLLAALAAESESRAAELLVEFGVEMDRLWAGSARSFGGPGGIRRQPSSKPSRSRARALEELVARLAGLAAGLERGDGAGARV